MLTTYLFRYSSECTNFVVKFSQFSSPQAARGHWPPNQNPADVPAWLHQLAVKFDFTADLTGTETDHCFSCIGLGRVGSVS